MIPQHQDTLAPVIHLDDYRHRTPDSDPTPPAAAAQRYARPALVVAV